jgi:hypothetical protein
MPGRRPQRPWYRTTLSCRAPMTKVARHRLSKLENVQGCECTCTPRLLRRSLNVIAQRTRRTHAPPPRRVARARMAVHRSVAATTLAVPRPSGYCSACGAYRPVIADTMRMTVRAAADELTRRKMAPLRHGTRSSDIVRAGIFTQGCAGADQEDWVTEPRMSGTRSLGQTRISLCGGPSGISGWIVYHGVTRPLLRYFGLERLTTPLELDSRDSAPLQWHNT